MSALLGALSFCPSGRGQSSASEKAMAESLYLEARKDMQAGAFGAACPKLVESQKIDPGVGTLLTLGECFERTGQTASGWATFLEAAALARTRGQPNREKQGRERAALLESRLSRLTVNVDSPTEGLEVKQDGQPLRRGEWGTPVAVDPGEHVIEASAAGRTTWTTRLVVGPEGARVAVSVPVLELAPPAPRMATSSLPPASSSAAAPASAGPGPAPLALGHNETRATGGSRQAALGGALGGVGVVGVILGIVFRVQANRQHDDAQTHCDPTCAAGGGDSLQATAKSSATVSVVSLVGGGLLLAGGVALFLTTPSPAGPRTTLWLAPTRGPGAGGIRLGGTF